MVIGICISCIVAIFQYYVGEPFWLLREKLGLPNEGIDLDRMPGLSADNIQFSFQLCLMIPLIYSLLWYRKNSMGEKAFLVFAFTVTSLALFVNATRSAIVGTVSSLFIMSLISKRYQGYHKISLAIVIIIGLLALLRPLHPRTFTSIGVPNRIVGYYLALSSLTENPLGLGSYQYYSEEADRFLNEIPLYTWAKVSYAPHNSLLDIGTYYGIPGLFLCLVFYYLIFKRISELRKQLEDPFLTCINIGILCSFISYLVNTCFHNRGFFNGEHFGWFFVGMLLFLSAFQKRSFRIPKGTSQLGDIPSG
jgi:O-antigen ligase